MAGVAEPLLDPCRRILEVYWESNNSLQGGKKGHLKKQLPLQVKMALVINGEFLVSVSPGRAAGPWYLGGGWEEPRSGAGDGLHQKAPRCGAGPTKAKGLKCHTERWFSAGREQGKDAVRSSREEGPVGAFLEGRGAAE